VQIKGSAHALSSWSPLFTEEIVVSQNYGGIPDREVGVFQGKEAEFHAATIKTT
jgi:hypothetical protein